MLFPFLERGIKKAAFFLICIELFEPTRRGEDPSMIRFHLFDMDHTLIDADCDVTWKQFLVRHRIAPESALAEAERFFADYNAGTLDQRAFVAFQLREFVGRTRDEIRELSRLHFEECIRPKCRPGAISYVSQCRSDGEKVAIITSTNSEVARPVADFFGIENLFGTPLELCGDRFTGSVTDYYVGAVKITVAERLAAKYRLPLSDFAAYGDSINDLPLLETVGHPYAVNPSPGLLEAAKRNGWPILDWNQG